jgi:hypothetical protein
MRRELFALHLPNPDRVTADYAVLAELSRGLSGGDILNVCVNAIHAGSTVAGDAGDAAAGDCEGEEGEGRALGGEEQEPEEDWVSAELIGGEIAFEGAGSSWPWMWSGGGV